MKTHWRPRLTLRVRFALVMVLGVAGVGGVGHLYLETRFLEELENELELRALETARYLSNDGVELLLQQDFVGLHKLLNDARSSGPDIAYAFVADAGGQVVAHSFSGGFPETLRWLNPLRGLAEHQIRRVAVFGEQFRDIAVPLHGGDLGTLRLGVRDGRIVRQVAAVRRELLLFLLAAVAISAAGTYAISFYSLKRLTAVSNALERFEPGTRCEPIPLRGRDEVTDLAVKVNEMTARLDSSHRKMMQAEKMVAAGLMASGIAHEINNPISGMQNCLRRIQADPHDVRQTEEYATLMLQATEHIERVVRGLLDFSRSAPTQKRCIDLRTVVTRAIELTAFRLEKSRIVRALSLPENPVGVLGAEAQLMQVVVNIVLNAVDAMPNGGRLDVALTGDGDEAALTVRDSGEGIAPEHMAMVFEPFFTTKPAGKGTGLGLAVTYGIVSDHGGQIDIKSQVGSGTQLEIRLPLCSKGNVDG